MVMATPTRLVLSAVVERDEEHLDEETEPHTTIAGVMVLASHDCGIGLGVERPRAGAAA
jgi:hypothetical protein